MLALYGAALILAEHSTGAQIASMRVSCMMICQETGVTEKMQMSCWANCFYRHYSHRKWEISTDPCN